jgi:hypothetical protein
VDFGSRFLPRLKQRGRVVGDFQKWRASKTNVEESNLCLWRHSVSNAIYALSFPSHGAGNMGSMATGRIKIVGMWDVLDNFSLAKIRATVSDNISVGVIAEVTIVKVDSCGDLVCQCCCSEMNLSKVCVHGFTYLYH